MLKLGFKNYNYPSEFLQKSDLDNVKMSHSPWYNRSTNRRGRHFSGILKAFLPLAFALSLDLMVLCDALTPSFLK